MYSASNTNEKNDTNQKQFNNAIQIILNICYYPDSGKLILSDNYNHHYSCDLFGRIKKKFLPNVTGQVSYQERKIKTEEKYRMSKTTNNFSIGEKGLIEYYPQTRKFDGYFNFPKPISPPFCNIPDYTMNSKTKNELISHLEKYFSDPKSKKYVSNEKRDIELAYLTGDLNEFDCLKVDSEKLLILIKNTLNSIKEEYALKMNIFNKVPIVKALKQFRKYIKENKESIMINNHILRKPNSFIKKKYDVVYRTITNFGLKKDKLRNIHNLKLETLNIDNISKPLSGIKHLTLDSLSDKSKEKHVIMKKLFKNDFKIGRKIDMDFGLFSFEEAKKIKTPEKTQTQAQTKNNKNVKTGKNEKNSITETHQETEATKETEQSLYVKSLDAKIKNNKLSFISKQFNFGNQFKKNQMKKIKQLKYLENNFMKETKLLKGFEKEERKGPILLLKNLKPKLKTNGELFDEEIALLRKTNPIAFKIQAQKDEFDLKQLIKKVNMLKVNEKNIMKGKKLQIKKEKSEQE